MLKKACRARILGCKGQSIVELVLITPLVLVALMIPADFGIAFMVAHQAENMVREYARIGAATDPFDGTALNTAMTSTTTSFRFSAYAPVSSSSVSLLSTGAATCAKIVKATATVSYPFTLYRIMRWFGFTVNPTKAITREARMRYEFQPATNSTPCT